MFSFGIATASSVANVIRVSKSRALFLFISDIAYYQYHHVQYSGLLAETIILTN